MFQNPCSSIFVKLKRFTVYKNLKRNTKKYAKINHLKLFYLGAQQPQNTNSKTNMFKTKYIDLYGNMAQ